MADQHSNQPVTDPSIAAIADTVINEWLDRWDSRWQPGLEYLTAIAEESRFIDDARALAELIRVDIDRRYSTNHQLNMSEYIHAFPSLLTNKDAMAAIAFEDFRSRRSAGLECASSIWSWIPGIGQQTWYTELNNTGLRETTGTSGKLWAVADTRSKQSLSVEPEIGSDFGEFKLIGFLGEGAFSRVYLAKQRLLGNRYVALKVVRRALSEPHHLARLHHTGIVPLYSLHRIGHYSALCMPYSGSTTLADWLSSTIQADGACGSGQPRSGQSLIDTLQSTQARLNQTTLPGSFSHDPISLPTWQNQSPKNSLMPSWSPTGPLDSLKSLRSFELALWLACRLAAALGHAHVRGIVHGDLKPANILIRNDGEPSLIDFNLAHDEDCHEFQHLGGTLPYMSPEQMKALIGRSSLLSSASDVYSLGIILYEIVEGRLPYSSPVSAAECDLDAAITVRQAEPILFSASNCGAGFRSIVRKCLAYHPHERYTDGDQLWEDLEAERRHQPLKYASEPLRSRLQKMVRRHPAASSNLAISLFASAIVSLCLLFGWMSWERWQSVAARTALTQLIDQTASEQSEMLDSSPDSIAELSGNWMRQARESLGYDGIDWSRSQLLSRLTTHDRELLVPALFENALPLAWFTFERSIDTTTISRSSEFSELVHMLRQIEQHQLSRPSPMLQWLTEYAHSETTSANSIDAPKTNLLSETGISGLPFRSNPESGGSWPQSLGVTERILWARLLILFGKPSEALEQLATVRDSRESRYLFWDTMGKAQLRLGEAVQARQSFLLAIEAAPRKMKPYQQCAAARIAMGDYAGAEQDLTRAIEVSATPNTPAVCDLLIQRAMVRERLDRVDQAIEDANRAAKLGHATNRLWLLRARLKVKLGDASGAEEDMAAGMKADPKSAGDWIARALARSAKEPQAALSDLQQALALEPNSTVAFQNMAYIQTELLQDEKGAIASLDRLLQIQPDHEGARGGRCVLLARAGSAAGSLADITYLEKNLYRLQPATRYQIGCAYALLSRQQPEYASKAIAYILQALPHYGADVVENDPDLDNLREQPTFQHLVELSKTWKKP